MATRLGAGRSCGLAYRDEAQAGLQGVELNVQLGDRGFGLDVDLVVERRGEPILRRRFCAGVWSELVRDRGLASFRSSGEADTRCSAQSS
ncbi:MAG TPA: hypothetical protein VHW05_08710 [Phenylobacterium sp.]|nr:hypothetical protein [Phenylobacterium sp.]